MSLCCDKFLVSNNINNFISLSENSTSLVKIVKWDKIGKTSDMFICKLFLSQNFQILDQNWSELFLLGHLYLLLSPLSVGRVPTFCLCEHTNLQLLAT